MTTATIPEPDVVGTAEAAEILGVVRPQVTRFKDSGRMPPIVADLDASPVWMREDVIAMRDGAGWPADREPLDLLGTGGAAALLKVNKSQIGRWRRAGVFPPPAKKLRSGPLWWRSQIDGFIAARRAA